MRTSKKLHLTQYLLREDDSFNHIIEDTWLEIFCIYIGERFKWPSCITVGEQYRLLIECDSQYGRSTAFSIQENDGTLVRWSLHIMTTQVEFIYVDKIEKKELFKLKLLL